MSKDTGSSIVGSIITIVWVCFIVYICVWACSSSKQPLLKLMGKHAREVQDKFNEGFSEKDSLKRLP